MIDTNPNEEIMKPERLEEVAHQLLNLGQQINKLSRRNSITNQTNNLSRDKTNEQVIDLVNEYNELATEVNENTEHVIDEYVTSEYVNSHKQVVVTATQNQSVR